HLPLDSRGFVMTARVCLLAALALAGPAAPAPADEPDPAELDDQTLRAGGVGTDGPALLDYFRKRVAPTTERRRIEELIEALGADSVPARQRASAELERGGHAAGRLPRPREPGAAAEA